MARIKVAGADAAAEQPALPPVAITRPNIVAVGFKIQGTAPLVMARFSEKARLQMETKMQEGNAARSKKNREARDFEADMEAAIHRSREGWIGFPASAFRNAAISACRLVAFKMTMAKLSIFTIHDGLDRVDGIPLVKLDVGKPEMTKLAARNASGVCDIRVRPMWREWGATLKMRFDRDQFTEQDVCNLIMRAGAQVGIGEGRPDSRESAGLGWGTFEIVD